MSSVRVSVTCKYKVDQGAGSLGHDACSDDGGLVLTDMTLDDGSSVTTSARYRKAVERQGFGGRKLKSDT